MQLPNDAALTQYARNQVQLNPRQYGYMGAYSRELLNLEMSEGMFGELMVRFTTSILSGRTVNETPVVEMQYPATWQDHFWHSADWWQSNKLRELRKSLRWFSYMYLIFWPVFLLSMIIRHHVRKHPVRYSKMTATVPFSQDVLFPEIDYPAKAGRPVIMEDISLMSTFQPETEQWGTSLRSDPSRFMSRYEIHSEFMRDPDYARYPHGYPGYEVEGFMAWLGRHGVNIDQLVKRKLCGPR